MSAPIQRDSKVFISINEALKASSRLGRLITLENELSGGIGAEKKRPGYIDKLESTWNSFVQDQRISFSQAQKNLKDCFSKCCRSPIQRTLPRAVSDQMVSWIEMARSMQELNWIRDSILKDCRTLRIESAPASKSSVGKFGPTLLVGYPNPGQQQNSWVAYVLKWTDQRETAGYMVYEAFLSAMRQPHFSIPENIWYDFQRNRSMDSIGLLKRLDAMIAEELDGSSAPIPPLLDSFFKVYRNTPKNRDEIQTPLEQKLHEADPAEFRYGDLSEEEVEELRSLIARELKRSFHLIPSSLDPSIKIHGRQLLVLERLNGENLGEFARFKYKDMDIEQKQHLFRLFGEIAVLDLLLGNTDRLLQLSSAEDSLLAIDSEGSNLGNLMFARNKEGLHSVYPIDNAVDEEFIKSPVKREAYLNFLGSVFGREGFEKGLASAILVSLRNGFYCYPSDLSKSVAKGEHFSVKTVAKELEEIMGLKCAQCMQGKQCIKGECTEGDLDRLFVCEALEEGIAEMTVQLKELAPLWQSGRAEFFKAQLHEIYPEYLQALEERIAVFDG